MPTLVPLLGDQLTPQLASLAAADRARTVVLMAEVAEEAAYVPHHKQKLALVFAAMRHFADALRAEGWTVDYRRLDDPDTPPSLTAALEDAAARHRATEIVAVLAAEHRLVAEQRRWSVRLGLPVTLLEDDRFLVAQSDFERWAAGRKTLRMEDFYRWQRRETGILMAGDTPVGGQWNFDRDNRKALPAGHRAPAPPGFAPDATTRDVLAMVAQRFPDNFGSLESFAWPVTRAQALAALEAFVADRLVHFGDYQDALADDNATLHHSLLSPAINLGLLSAREAIDAAVAALEQGAPLNAVEGFVRQLLGWREYVRLIYFREGPAYLGQNALDARRPLPRIYWQGNSGMRCFDRAFEATRDLAYAHHIQRLMVLGNFALLAGVNPAEVQHWYLLVYADAYEWVEAPNVVGMALFADGGLLASKPYAAGGAYIDRMGDHCRHCRYDVKQRTGAQACPFNSLYWAFIARHRARLQHNHRMRMILNSWDKMKPETQSELLATAEAYLDKLE
jgi:deoxyribodipyrimidine photolyase-related protein